MASFIARAYTCRLIETVAHMKHKDLRYCAVNMTESCPFSQENFDISTVKYNVFSFHIFGI
jgi:hypothetical protein